MDIAVFSAKPYEKKYLSAANDKKHQLSFIEEFLDISTAEKAIDHQAVCCFVTDNLDKDVIKNLAKLRVKLIALRSAGFDHVDLEAAKNYNIHVVNVPQYSPQVVAEFAVCLILTLNRKILTAYLNGKNNNFALDDLLGFNLYKKTVGIIGTGFIGTAFAKIMHGFGCNLLAYDPVISTECQQLKVRYVSLKELLANSDIVSLHCPLTKNNYHMLDTEEFQLFKDKAMLINTARGALINTAALITALEIGKITYAGLDVYEKERGLFFLNHTGAINDELFTKLQAMSNVLITPHQAFFTKEALTNIAKTTIENITAFQQGQLINMVI